MIADPDGIRSSYETHRPSRQKIAPNKNEASMIFLRLDENCLAIEGGTVSRARLRMMRLLLLK